MIKFKQTKTGKIVEIELNGTWVETPMRRELRKTHRGNRRPRERYTWIERPYNYKEDRWDNKIVVLVEDLEEGFEPVRKEITATAEEAIKLLNGNVWSL